MRRNSGGTGNRLSFTTWMPSAGRKCPTCGRRGDLDPFSEGGGAPLCPQLSTRSVAGGCASPSCACAPWSARRRCSGPSRGCARAATSRGAPSQPAHTCHQRKLFFFQTNTFLENQLTHAAAHAENSALTRRSSTEGVRGVAGARARGAEYELPDGDARLRLDVGEAVLARVDELHVDCRVERLGIPAVQQQCTV